MLPTLVAHAFHGHDDGAVVRDIVRTQVSVTRDVGTPGLSGSAVIEGRVTDVVDIDGVLAYAGVLLPSA